MAQMAQFWSRGANTQKDQHLMRDMKRQQEQDL